MFITSLHVDSVHIPIISLLETIYACFKSAWFKSYTLSNTEIE